mgnify:CR=1 FL=1
MPSFSLWTEDKPFGKEGCFEAFSIKFKTWILFSESKNPDITVSLSDTSNLSEVKVALSVAKDPDGLVDNETLGAAGNFLIDGILSSASSSNLNSTVNISSTSNNASVTFTITGTDASGNAQTETITGVNNNTVEGTKYFKTITQISYYKLLIWGKKEHPF